MNKAALATIFGTVLLSMSNSKGSKDNVKYLPEDIFMRLIYGSWGPMAYLADIQDITMDQIVEATKHHRVTGKESTLTLILLGTNSLRNSY